MAKGDLQDDVRALRRQVEALRDAFAKVAEPYREIAGYLEQLQSISRGHFRLLDLYAKPGAVSPDVVVPGLKDDISEAIVTALFEKADRNISQIAEAVKVRRGTASRRIVREGIQTLVKDGVIVASSGARGHTYRVSEEVVEKWSHVLGLSKCGDQPETTQEERGGPDDG